MKFLFCFIAIIAVVYLSPTSFKAAVTVTHPGSINGKITGTIHYSVSLQRYMIEYKNGVKELYLFDKDTKYLKCGTKCDAETTRDKLPRFDKQSGDSNGPTQTVNGITGCVKITKQVRSRPNDVKYTWISGNNVCQVEFVSGKIFTFGSHAGLVSTIFNQYTSWNCPKQQCNVMMDLMLVFDESGSVRSSDFTLMKNFAKDIANSYTIGVNNVKMGLAMFSSSSRLIIGLSTSKTSVINAINRLSQRGGSTCIGCGIDTARIATKSGGRLFNGKQVARVCIVLTDGCNNRGTSTYQSVINKARSSTDGNMIMFGIGVGTNVCRNDVEKLKSTISGVQTTFYTTSFSALKGVLNSLITATCVDFPGNPCGAGCKGFCSCGQKCICPDSCDDNNKCTTDKCVIGQAGNGCQNTKITCNDKNACTTDTCNPSTGCVYTPFAASKCNDNNACTKDSCSPSFGCQHKPISCNDNNGCTRDSCNPGNGCQYTSIPCDKCKDQGAPIICQLVNCKNVGCDPNDGLCKSTDVVCDDGNACTADSCDATTGNCTFRPIACDDGNACTIDSCDPSTGCVFTPVATDYCDDKNACTDETCDTNQGCVYTNVTCPADVCSTAVCNSITGCSVIEKDCDKEPRIAKLIGDCYQSKCNTTANKGCYLEQLENTTIDECGNCKGSGDCTFDVDTAEVAVLSGILLASILVLIIAVVAAIALFGGKKGYDIYMNSRGPLKEAQHNPLYQDNGMSGSNPLYGEEMQ